MLRRTVKFNCSEDLQMKAVALLIQKASVYRSSIWVKLEDGRRANAKSLLGLMSLAMQSGMTVEIEANGEDEAEAIKGIGDYLSGFFS